LYDSYLYNGEESMTATPWDFRNKLTVILNTAEHSGKPFVDVESSNLHTEMGGDPNSNHRMPIFHEVMTRMMRPGDSVLKDAGSGDSATLIVRYILKNKLRAVETVAASASPAVL
jgi:hypothetical protein